MSQIGIPVGSIESDLELVEIYPKRLPPLNLEAPTDETTFTLPEKSALNSAWRYFDRQKRQISVRVFVDFYSEHETLINRFRDSSGKIQLASFTSHGSCIVEIFEKLIRIGLRSNGQIDSILARFVWAHRMKAIPQNELILLTTELQRQYVSFFGPQTSPTLTNAVRKLCYIIHDAHEEGRRRSSVVPIDTD